VRITHFISFGGAHLPATAENYAMDAASYAPSVRMCIASALHAENDHDRHAYALTAGMYAKVAAHCGLRALDENLLRHDHDDACYGRNV
jgi:hypothetical protein